MRNDQPQDTSAIAACNEDEIDSTLDTIISKIRAIRFCVDSMLERIEIKEE